MTAYTCPVPKSWYAIRVRSNHEWKTTEFLKATDHEAYLPLYWDRRKYSDRMKEVQVPLFPGYVFCRAEPIEFLPIQKAVGVVGIVGFGKTPIPVPEEELDAVRRAVQMGQNPRPWPYLNVGQRVCVQFGALKGLEGILTGVKSQERIVISIELLQRSVSVEIDPACVSVISRERGLAAKQPKSVTELDVYPECRKSA